MARVLKRPAPEPVSDTSSSSSSNFASQKSLRLSVFSSNLKILIVEDKLEDGEKQLYEALVSKYGGRVVQSPEAAEVIVTQMKSPKRLARSVPQSLWPDKTFVPLAWIKQSIDQEKQMPFAPFALTFDDKARPLESRTQASSVDIPVASTSFQPADQPASATVPKARKSDSLPAVHYSIEELQAKYKNSTLACDRFCPLVCCNEALVQELGVIKLGRLLLDGNETSALSYSRAISAIKGYPWPITTKTKYHTIKGIGQGVASKIDEYFRTGRMQDADTYRNNPKLAELRKLEQVYGIGAHTARKLHDKGYTTPEKLPEEYHIEWTDEFAQKIPRQEVEEIAELVAQHLEKVRPGAEYCITGGYRRGKPASNDIDIVMTHREEGKDKHMLKELTDSLKADGIIVNVIYQTSTGTDRPPGAQNFHASRLDPLDKNFCVFLPPKRGCLQQIHRRVDLIATPYKYYWTAIVGWSGSTMFERDLRRWAHTMDYKFDSGGLTNRTTSEDFIAESEEHLFELLKLPYIPPNYRNADV